MRKNLKTIVPLLVVSFLASCALFTSSSFGQELPKPGEVINKKNIKKYSHLFPEQYLPGIEDGWGGLVKPQEFKIVETKSYPMHKRYMASSEQNRGKFSFDEKGWIVGDFDSCTLPFPGVTPEDKDFATKVMWNFAYTYNGDDVFQDMGAYQRRRGEGVTWVHCNYLVLKYAGRQYFDPKPLYETPERLYSSDCIVYLSPSNLRNLQVLSYKYIDYWKPDDTYLYLPQMRRVLRGEAGQRSTPLAGSIQATDDFWGGFYGKTQDFTYKYLGSEKKLMSFQSRVSWALSQEQIKADPSTLPFPPEGWEVRDTYVIEIKPKNPKYPQGRKVIYLEQENLHIAFTIAWDRAGEAWKIWNNFWEPIVLSDGDLAIGIGGMFGVDMQFGMASNYMTDNILNRGLTYAEETPSAMIKRAR